MENPDEGLPGSRLLTRQERWRLRNPEAVRAHNAVKEALRTGKLVKLPCQVCGSPHSEAHHPNYDKPLRVRWLCRIHHKRLHQRQILKRARSAIGRRQALGPASNGTSPTPS